MATATTRSGSKPNLRSNSLSGADAPKVFMPMTRPAGPAPQQRRQKTLEALTAQLEALSRSKPVLMIFEDVHWIDPTSLEAVGRSVDRICSLGVLLIITYRPEFEPPCATRTPIARARSVAKK